MQRGRTKDDAYVSGVSNWATCYSVRSRKEQGVSLGG